MPALNPLKWELKRFFILTLPGILFLLILPLFPSSATSATLIPLNAGARMTCQFVNNTGSYTNSQIYVMAISLNSSNQYCYLDAGGNMIPLVAGQNAGSFAIPLSSFNGYQFPPVMTSARLYVSLGSPLNIPINPGTPVGIAYPNINNPSDPNINTSFDWIEYNIGNNQIFCNTTQVDMFGISMLMDLFDNAAGGAVSLNGEVGTTESTSSLMNQYLTAVPAAFAGLEGPLRIAAPLHGSFGTGGANAGYFDSYINSVWTQYTGSNLVITLNTGTYTGRVDGSGRLAFTKPGDATTYYISKPTTNDVWGGAGALASGNPTELALEAQMCAAFHRHVIDNAPNMNNVPSYYLNPPTDYFSQFWHQHNVGAKAYGFCYDDVNNQSSSLISNNPRAIVLYLGGGTASTPVPTATPTRTPTPVVASTWRVNAGGPAYTDGSGNLWSADTNFTGGTPATVTSAINGTTDDALYQTERYGNPFTYTFNVPAGSYQVTLKFAETYTGISAAGQRVFNVSINGTQFLTNLDIFSEVGLNNTDDKVFNNISPSGGVITIQFGPASVDNAKISAIQIIPMPVTPTPTRTTTFTSTVTRTFTATNTNTPVPPSNTFTHTRTITATNTNTPVPPTNTFTSTTTRTFTSTPTKSFSPSMTASFTPSATATASLTNTRTSTQTGTNTPTISSTFTATATRTFTSTNASTNTRTNTPASTDTATSTKTSTNTPVPPTATFTATFTTTGTSTFTSTSTPTYSSTLVPPTVTPTSTLSRTATATPTGTSSFTPSQTSSFTRTSTATPTVTGTSSFTPSNTPFLTPSSTPTSTFLIPNLSPVVYPNPWTNSTPVHLRLFLQTPGEVKVKLFTTAFRKVWQEDFLNEPAGNDDLALDIPIVANGIYYLWVTTPSGRGQLVKLLVTR